MSNHDKINYVELPAKDLTLAKHFFSTLFNWSFTDYGAEYTAFSDTSAGLNGGFFQSDLASNSQHGGALIVLYSDDLEDTLEKIEAFETGEINREIFHFPGGRRFHFLDPNGNEFAVWSDIGIEVA